MAVGVLTIFADFMGAIGSGSGILLAVNIIYGYFEQYNKDKKKSTLFQRKCLKLWLQDLK